MILNIGVHSAAACFFIQIENDSNVVLLRAGEEVCEFHVIATSCSNLVGQDVAETANSQFVCTAPHLTVEAARQALPAFWKPVIHSRSERKDDPCLQHRNQQWKPSRINNLY